METGLPGPPSGALARVDLFDLGIQSPPSPRSETVPARHGMGLGDGDKKPHFRWSVFGRQAAILLVPKQRDGQTLVEAEVKHAGFRFRILKAQPCHVLAVGAGTLS